MVVGALSSLTFSDVIPARAPWSRVVPAGETLRIVDLEGNQAVDCLLYDAHDVTHRYSAADTVAAQANIFLVEGTELVSNEGVAMMRITGSTCAYHDTVGGACSRESNTLRYGHHTKHQHACVENFLLAHSWRGMGKRDMTSNINWFMNVPVEPDGRMYLAEGVSQPGDYVELEAEMDVLAVISNCHQLYNPVNGWNPTPIRVQVEG